MANPSWYYCTGPVFVWVSNDPLALNPQYLGTCEQFPVFQGEHAWTPVFNDLGGPVIPSERQYHGKRAFVSLDMNKMNQNVLDAVLATPRQELDGGVPGSTAFLDMGAFLIQNGCGVSMWLVNSFYGTANSPPALGMPPGVFLPYCMLTGDYIDRQGTSNKKHRLDIEAQEARQPNGGQFLYSTLLADMAGLNAILPE